LSRNQERKDRVGGVREVTLSTDEIILMTSIGVAGTVGVVLKQVDVAFDSFFAQAPLSVDNESFQDSLPRAIMMNQLKDVVTFRRCVFGVASHVEI
jgi:hypothetical protein